MNKRYISLVCLLLTALLALSGCAGGSKDDSAALKTVVASVYVKDDNTSALAETLTAALPEGDGTQGGVAVRAVSTGDTESDPSGAMAGMTLMMGLMATGDIELLICDADNARRYGDNGETYIPLNELFTEEEQQVLGIVPVSVPVMDDDGNLTGEMSAPCGVDLSGRQTLTELFYAKDLSAYVMAGCQNTENAKAAIRCLLTLE